MENLVHSALLLSAPSTIAEAKKNTTMIAEGEVGEAGYLIIFLLKALSSSSSSSSSWSGGTNSLCAFIVKTRVQLYDKGGGKREQTRITKKTKRKRKGIESLRACNLVGVRAKEQAPWHGQKKKASQSFSVLAHLVRHYGYTSPLTSVLVNCSARLSRTCPAGAGFPP